MDAGERRMGLLSGAGEKWSKTDSMQDTKYLVVVLHKDKDIPARHEGFVQNLKLSWRLALLSSLSSLLALLGIFCLVQ